MVFPATSGCWQGAWHGRNLGRIKNRIRIVRDKGTTRMELDVAKASFTKEELIKCGRGSMFGEGNARLPLPPMLMFDRITKITDDSGKYGVGEIIAELDISPSLWFFHCHFKNDPVMPGCLGLDAMWQLLGFFLVWKGFPGRGRARGGEIKFNGAVLPTANKVTYKIDVKRVRDQRLKMGIADAEMSVDGNVIYTATDLSTVMTTSSNLIMNVS